MDFVLVPVLVIGIILGILELVFVHQDEAGMGWLKHGLHAIPTMLIFIFIAMNVPWVEEKLGLGDKLWLTILIRVLIGVVAAIKIKGAAAVAGRVGENWPHVLILATLVVVSPFIWEMFLCTIPFIKNLPMNGCPA
ncbi:MAG: hypothetical protein ACP5OA_02690 [Candidatus Woesearchaeota archaeon]